MIEVSKSSANALLNRARGFLHVDGYVATAEPDAYGGTDDLPVIAVQATQPTAEGVTRWTRYEQPIMR